MSRKDLTIFDTREEVFERDSFQCQYEDCIIKGWNNLQLSHKISRSKKNIEHVIRFWYNEYDKLITKKEAETVLNGKLNLVTSCAEHNSSFLIDAKPVEIDKLLRRIKQGINSEDIIDECCFSGRMPT